MPLFTCVTRKVGPSLGSVDFAFFTTAISPSAAAAEAGAVTPAGNQITDLAATPSGH